MTIDGVDELVKVDIEIPTHLTEEEEGLFQKLCHLQEEGLKA